MKGLIILIMACSIASTTMGQNNIQVYINGHNGVDTITINEFMNIQHLSINNSNYTITGFQLNIMDRGFLKEFKRDSNEITEEMRNAVGSLKGKNMKTAKIFFEDIKVKTPEGKIKTIGGLLHIIKIE